MQTHTNNPGFLAIAPTRPGSASHPDVASVFDRLALAGGQVQSIAGALLATWGIPAPTSSLATPLSNTIWSGQTRVDLPTLTGQLASSEDEGLRSMLPPFGLLGTSGDSLMIASDHMGFRQLFARRHADWNAWSTSARLLARLTDTQLRTESLLVQSVVGWQLAEHTLYRDVVKLEPGECVTISSDGIQSRLPEPHLAPSLNLAEAIPAAVEALRTFSERYMDEYTDPIVQLTGGLDSRLILSAIPEGRRRGLQAMTIGSANHPDVVRAAELSARYGMRHTVVDLDGLARLSPAESFERVCAAAIRLDGMVDPIAKAVTIWAEERVEQGPRIGGVGGEIARGFYYLGRVSNGVSVTRARASQVARWRMFANEAVDPGLLVSGMTAEAHAYSVDLVFDILRETGLDWYRATDALYAKHRVPRWAGLNESVVCFDRELINPLLDHEYCRLVERVAPPDKAHARFFTRLLVALDPELASIPLDGGRPAPATLASPDISSQLARLIADSTRIVRKVRQRVLGGRRPAVGAVVLASNVLEHIRSAPEVLDPLFGLELISDDWLAGVSAGTLSPSPASIAFVINVLMNLPDAPPEPLGR